MSKLLRWFTLIFPLVFLWLGLVYKDVFYFFLFFGFLILSVFVILPKFFSDKHITFTLNLFKKKKHSEHKLPTKKQNLPHLFNGIMKKAFLLSVITLIFFTFFFLFLTLFHLKITSQHSIFFEYYESFFRSIVGGWGLLLIAFVILSVYLFNQRIKTFFGSILIVFSILILSFNVAFFTSFLVAAAEMHLVTSKLVSDPKGSGIFFEAKTIKEKLKKTDPPPKVYGITSDLSKSIVPFYVEDQSKNKGEFYKAKVLKNIPQFLTPEADFPNASIALVKDNLLIKEINKEEIQLISPILGKLMVKQYIKPHYIKDEPKVSVLGRQEYLKFRDDEINKQIKKIDEALTEIKGYINTFAGRVQEDRAKIAANQSAIDDAVAQKESKYNYCLTLADYYEIEKSYCDRVKTQWDALIAEYQKNIEGWQEQLAYDQKQLQEYQELEPIFENYREMIASQKDLAPQELGLFEPENSIKVVLDKVSPKAVTDFLATLTHEYLHYTSYVSEERTLPQFFEEGLTEYYSRKTIEKALNRKTNMGYPVLVKIIEEMAKKIPKEELERIYFTKSETDLIAVLDSAYGKDFYKDSEYYFTAISFAPPRESLKIANNIMFRIGGKDLKEEDLYSAEATE